MVKCQVCSTINNYDETSCSHCNWDLKKYNLSSYGFRTERKNKLQWARDRWLELCDMRNENEQLCRKNEQLESKCKELEARHGKLESRCKELESWYGELKSRNEKLESRLKARYPETSLENSRYIDISQLDEFLSNKEWEKADKETSYLILEIYKLQEVGYINKKDFHGYYYKRQAGESLKHINDLWVLHSDNKFGFTVQWSIYKSIVKKNNLKLNKEVDEKDFDDRYFSDFKSVVGWNKHYSYSESYYKKMFDDFREKNLELPNGRLPILRAGQKGDNRDKRIHAFWQLFE